MRQITESGWQYGTDPIRWQLAQRPPIEPIAHCRRGHPYNDENTYQCKSGRYCRKCMAINTRNYNERRRAQ